LVATQKTDRRADATNGWFPTKVFLEPEAQFFLRSTPGADENKSRFQALKKLQEAFILTLSPLRIHRRDVAIIGGNRKPPGAQPIQVALHRLP
jgi:hypothetical protein